MELHGRALVKSYSKRGELQREMRCDNLVVATGRNRVASIFATNDGSVATPEHIRIGTGSTPPTDLDMNLVGTVLASELASVTAAGHEVSMQATLTNNSAEEWNVNEAGVFADEAGPVDTMFSRFLTPQFKVEIGGFCTILWKIGFGAPPVI